ncbi:MAG: GIY-YIG nuclease family protein [Proteobacteria bacterium]|nr:GIY-YIG nuclease family protein [Pseudomonadota bacterium]
MISGIYIIRNLISKKVYIGSAVRLNRRRATHFRELKNRTHKNPHLQRAYIKDGADIFEFKVLIHCDIDDLLWYEQRAIEIYKEAIGWDNMYNISPTAGSNLGKKLSPETKDKISASNKGKSRNKGKTCSRETKNKMSEAHKGKKHSAETLAKMSQAQKGNSNSKGCKTDEEGECGSITLICDNCGKKFERYRCQIKSEKVFCSSACHYEARGKGIVKRVVVNPYNCYRKKPAS